VAVKEEKYDKARKHLEIVTEWTANSYREQELSLAHAAEEFGRALASLGALAFTERDFTEARTQYLKALGQSHLAVDRRDRYRRSYLVASNALAAEAASEAEARAILDEMAKKGVTPNEITVISAIKTTETFERCFGFNRLLLGKGIVRWARCV